MPQVGDIKPDREIGKGQGRGNKYIYITCPDCYKERWVRLRGGKPERTYCYDCAMKKVGISQRGRHNPLWRGGKQKAHSYVKVKLQSGDFFSPMSDKKGYVPEHRLVMAKYLSHCLLSWEIVHHRNGIRTDNRIENLELVSARKYHIIDSHIKAENKRLHNRVKQLEGKVALLETEITKIFGVNSDRAR